MAKGKRILIFLALLILFLVAAPAAVMYCLGWRLDLKNGRITEPGMFYFKASPKTADVYLDGKLQKRTDIFFGSILIENLEPKEYEIEIKKDGYHGWKKKLAIQKREVTEAKNIILFPLNPNFSLISESAEYIYPAPDGRKIVIKEYDEVKKKWSLKILDTAKNSKTNLLSEEDLGKIKHEFSNISFSEDSERILLETKYQAKNRYFIVSLADGKFTEADFGNNVLDKIILHPSEKTKLFVAFSEKKTKNSVPEKNIYEVDLLKKITSGPLAKNISDFTISDRDAYWIDEEGFLLKSGLDFKNPRRMNVQKTVQKNLTLKTEGSEVFMESEQSLYIFNKKTLSFEKLLDGIKGYRLSPNSKQLLYFNDNELWILFLEKKHEQPHKEAGDKVLVSSEIIGDAFWHINNYIAYTSQNKVKISEIDDRGEFNSIEFFEMENPQMLYSQNNLYILSKGSIYSCQDLKN
ncbi:MAG: hypothetical protein A2365_04100 [Candidatus Nealsonbacteria bacterium RIFOXYB1_FULL_40_15]|uniref:PEGA domain-containing protein n=2 Tax=Candidatus Nealsoniibacteriota TaxID=1817911 RepID=A0A1G2ELP2_9BACT|nr:MAG: hypothetical protein A2427_04415 [Candidatus Nealsonbacteria bacterium RIFOXYC1_FULL_40_7]OGZ27789.1 MAG: hypothetical protein A2365_04100 [Candidatus Nealsonbacteria bacterium RIFOXYB1_FULL_40_15]OGZ28630.1 MAG: hypothetical protein A2562_03800 [Candidatus Nealsonbacteria bacterium RIFOXYD1_FULL_39_11]